MIKRKAILATLLLALLASVMAGADPVEDLTSFTAGTPALASEVNANFTEVAESVNDNDARLMELQNRIATLETQLSNLVALNDFLSLETVNGQPTIRVTAANLQLVNGLGDTATRNGTGNLLIGYDEERNGAPQCSLGTDPNTGEHVANEAECMTAGGVWALSHKSGSHYLIVGARHNYSRWGGIVVGDSNTSNFDFASVSGGRLNTASGLCSSVSGGQANIASDIGSSVSGGVVNTATGFGSSVSGGEGRSANDTNDWAAGSLFEDF